MNAKALTLLLVIFGLLLAALLLRNGDLAWMAMPFLAYLGIGLFQAPAAEHIRLEANRALNRTVTEGKTSVEMTVTVRNLGSELHHLRLADPWQPGMKLTTGSLEQHTALPAGAETSFQYTFQSERGSFAWKELRASASDPFELTESRLELPAPAEIQVQPEMNRFRPLPLRPRSTLHSPGSIPARLGGSGTDFWGVREYHPGDPLRWLDWRQTARHPRQFFTKEFEQEEIADIGLILDARKRLDLRLGEESLFEHSVRAAASLAEVFLRQGHRVSLLVYGEKLVRVFPGYGKQQFHRILRCLAKATPSAEAALDSLEYLPTRLFSSHCLVIVISPMASNDWHLFPRLRAHGYQGLLISPDPISFAGPILPQDEAGRLALRAVRLERHLELRSITELQIPVVDWKVSQPLFPLVRNALRNSRRAARFQLP